MLVHFTERIGADLINQINSYMVKTKLEKTEYEGEKTQNSKEIKERQKSR